MVAAMNVSAVSEVVVENRGFGPKAHFLMKHDTTKVLALLRCKLKKTELLQSAGCIGFLSKKPVLANALGYFSQDISRIGDRPLQTFLVIAGRLFDSSSPDVAMELKDYFCWRQLTIRHKNEIILQTSTILYPLWETLFCDGGFSSIYLDIRYSIFSIWARARNSET